jgi:hypothetical protein
MTTITKNYSHTNVSTNEVGSSYAKFIKKLEFSYFGLISFSILLGSIVAGLAAMQVLKNDAPIWQLGMVAAVSMASNTACIGQAPTKWVFNLMIVSLVVNALLILANV